MLHDFPDLEPKHPVVKATLQNPILFWELKSLDKPVHLGINISEYFLAFGGNFFFRVPLFAHEVLQVSYCSICFKDLLCDRSNLIELFSQHFFDILFTPCFKSPSEVGVRYLEDHFLSHSSVIPFLFDNVSVSAKVSAQASYVCLSQYWCYVITGFLFQVCAGQFLRYWKWLYWFEGVHVAFLSQKLLQIWNSCAQISCDASSTSQASPHHLLESNCLVSSCNLEIVSDALCCFNSLKPFLDGSLLIYKRKSISNIPLLPVEHFQLVLLKPPTSENEFESAFVKIMFNICTILTFYLFDMGVEGLNGLVICLLHFFVSAINLLSCTILPFGKVVSHVSSHESQDGHIYPLVFSSSNIYFMTGVFDIMKTFHKHTLLQNIFDTQ